jgi:hypothetical protein
MLAHLDLTSRTLDQRFCLLLQKQQCGYMEPYIGEVAA